MPRNDVRQVAKQRGKRCFIGGNALEFTAKPIKCHKTFFILEITLIGKIVSLTGKMVNYFNCPPQTFRQKNGSDGKVFVVIDGHFGTNFDQ